MYASGHIACLRHVLSPYENLRWPLRVCCEHGGTWAVVGTFAWIILLLLIFQMNSDTETMHVYDDMLTKCLQMHTQRHTVIWLSWVFLGEKGRERYNDDIEDVIYNLTNSESLVPDN